MKFEYLNTTQSVRESGAGLLRVLCRRLLPVRDDHLRRIAVHYDGRPAHVPYAAEPMPDAEMGQFVPNWVSSLE